MNNEPATTVRVVTVFGGTGFLGRCAVRQLRRHGYAVRVASRHPDRTPWLFGAGGRQVPFEADIHDEQSVAEAVFGAYGVINAVSLYVERGSETFHSVHVAAAQRVAAQAQRAGVKRLVHVSGIGADAASSSRYIRNRGEGEAAVRRAFAGATLIRPAVMFGADDAFLTTIIRLMQRFPAFPMFSGGRTRLQPAYVDDVADAIARLIDRDQTQGRTFECGGPEVYSYEELLRIVAREAGLKPRLIPVPFAAWQVLARMAEMLPSPPVTGNQVELMQHDNVPAPEIPGFAELEITPHAVDEIIREIMWGH
ncbi:MAG: complex I NDUFA9 subunit family protein [Xanthobacteraceae bacterium]|nr:complex I NDUFA9 subunit family protein [Xanthobacteraceae bacterium]